MRAIEPPPPTDPAYRITFNVPAQMFTATYTSDGITGSSGLEPTRAAACTAAWRDWRLTGARTD